MASKRVIFDLVSAFILFAVALGGALFPSYLMKRRRLQGLPERGFLFQMGNMLSAGERHREFPLGTFLCGLGLVVTLVADQVAEVWSASYGIGNMHGHQHAESDSVAEEEPDRKMLDKQSTPSDRPKDYNPLEIDVEAHKPKTPRVSIVTAVLLSMALSLHSVLEGLALGAQQTVDKSIRIMIAVVAHKGLAAYALGASLLESRLSNQHHWALLLIFSLASPVGVVFGVLVSEVASGAVSSSLSALASGTFLYVAVFEVIPKELASPEHKFEKLSAMVLGFALMSILAIWA